MQYIHNISLLQMAHMYIRIIITHVGKYNCIYIHALLWLRIALTFAQIYIYFCCNYTKRHGVFKIISYAETRRYIRYSCKVEAVFINFDNYIVCTRCTYTYLHVIFKEKCFASMNQRQRVSSRRIGHFRFNF